MLKKDGTPWFSLELSSLVRAQYQSEIDKKSELVELWYHHPLSNRKVALSFPDTGIPLVPHSWYHVCLGLDTESGLLRIVVNGIEVVDEEKEEFRNTTAWKPQSIEGKILVFKEYLTGFWAQQRGKFTNMNIITSMTSLEDMMLRTTGEADCRGPGDYLSWDEMEWRESGDVTSGTMDVEELCRRYFCLRSRPLSPNVVCLSVSMLKIVT